MEKRSGNHQAGRASERRRRTERRATLGRFAEVCRPLCGASVCEALTRTLICVILSKSAADIPIDLATRRVILYGQSGGDWRADLAHKVATAVAKIVLDHGLG